MELKEKKVVVEKKYQVKVNNNFQTGYFKQFALLKREYQDYRCKRRLLNIYVKMDLLHQKDFQISLSKRIT